MAHQHRFQGRQRSRKPPSARAASDEDSGDDSADIGVGIGGIGGIGGGGGAGRRAQQLFEAHETQQEDAALQEMADLVARLGHMGRDIHDELEAQHLMLSDLQEDIDDSADSLAIVNRKMDTLLKAAGCSRCKIILALGGVLFILVALIVYT